MPILFQFFGRIILMHDKRSLQLIKCLPLFRALNGDFKSLSKKLYLLALSLYFMENKMMWNQKCYSWEESWMRGKSLFGDSSHYHAAHNCRCYW